MTRTKKGKKQQRKVGKPAKKRATASLTQGAPASVSSVVRQSVRFSGGTNGESLVMDVCAPICQVGAAATGSAGAVPGIFDGVAGINQSGQLALTTFEVQDAGTSAAGGYTSPVWDLIASAFVRYRVRALSFHYAPQSTTTTDNRMVFAFAEDPIHPLIWSATVSQNSLLALSDSMPFAPWLPWKMDVTHRLRDSDLLYTYDPTSVNPGNVSSPMERFSSFGSIGLLAATAGASPVAYGVLYMCTKVELVEFCPVSLSRPSLSVQLKELQARVPERKAPRRGREQESKGGTTLVDTTDCEPIRVPQFDRKAEEKSAFPITSQGVVTTLRSLASNRWKADGALKRLEGELEAELDAVREELGTDSERPENRMILSRLKRTLDVLRAATSVSAELSSEASSVEHEC